MGYDQHEQSNSSATLVAVLVAVVLVAVLGILFVAGAALFWVRAARTESRVAIVAEQQAVEETLRAKAMTLRSALEEARAEATPDPRLNFQVTLDREGNASVDGEIIDVDELKAQLVKLKEETSNAFSVRINADDACPVKHLVPLLDVCEEVGDIDYRVVSTTDAGVRITAVVASYELAVEWDHFDDGRFATYDKMTLKVVAPERHAGKTLSITVPPTKLPEDSAFRTAGTRLTFTMRAPDLTATGLAWGAIGNPTVEQ